MASQQLCRKKESGCAMDFSIISVANLIKPRQESIHRREEPVAHSQSRNVYTQRERRWQRGSIDNKRLKRIQEGKKKKEEGGGLSMDEMVQPRGHCDCPQADKCLNRPPTVGPITNTRKPQTFCLEKKRRGKRDSTVLYNGRHLNDIYRASFK